MNSAVVTTSSLNHRRQYTELFLASVVGLYFEILIIRWLAAEVRLFSYFKNLTMMAAFIGFGLGFALANRRRDFRNAFIPILLMYVPLVLLFSRVTGFKAIVLPEGGEYFWRSSALSSTTSTILFAVTIIIFFLLTLFLFIPFGQLIGRRMTGLPPISAYITNLLGSLLGIWIFAGISYLGLSPWTWFLLGLLITLWLFRGSQRILVRDIIFSTIVIVLLGVSQGKTIWSPYYRLDLLPLELNETKVQNPDQLGYGLYVNQIGHMFAVNLSPTVVDQHPEFQATLQTYSILYDLPYLFSEPENVLVIGAGMGNDVAAGLRNNVARIDAVEIDPGIYKLGVEKHPEQPYNSPKVNVIIDDARSYLEKTDRKYDLIVFGILDSQTLLSGMSSVRLDNYVYTVESVQQARERLNPDGVIALTFDVERWWIKQRLANILSQAFGKPPIQLSINNTAWTVYVSGYEADDAEILAICEERRCTIEAPSVYDPVPLATDDWPYLYLIDRRIPTPYWITLLLVLVIAWVGSRKAFTNSQSTNWHFFLLGGAFLLIEFKIITESALLFGSTWIVNAVAISAVLVMVLFANLMINKVQRLNQNLLYVCLLLSLVLGFLIPHQLFLPFGFVVRIGMSILLMGLPLFFSSAIFAMSLKQTSDIAEVFSSNFLGSAVGGMLEYGSLVFGIRSLYLLGLALYIGSWITSPIQRISRKLRDR